MNFLRISRHLLRPIRDGSQGESIIDSECVRFSYIKIYFSDEENIVYTGNS